MRPRCGAMLSLSKETTSAARPGQLQAHVSAPADYPNSRDRSPSSGSRRQNRGRRVRDARALAARTRAKLEDLLYLEPATPVVDAPRASLHAAQANEDRFTGRSHHRTVPRCDAGIRHYERYVRTVAREEHPGSIATDIHASHFRGSVTRHERNGEDCGREQAHADHPGRLTACAQAAAR